MKLQDLIQTTDLDMTLPQVKAFFLGTMSAQKPLPFGKALEELLSASPDARPVLEDELKGLWDELGKKKKTELELLFEGDHKLRDYLLFAKDQLDYFLTALSLAGTHVDSCDDEDTADLLDDLEETVMELDEILSEEKLDLDEGEELKEFLLETWRDFLKTKPF